MRRTRLPALLLAGALSLPTIAAHAVDVSATKQAAVASVDKHARELTALSDEIWAYAETALRATCRKFRERWAFMEGAAWGQGKRIAELDMNEMQQLWDQAKMLHVGEASHD